MRVKWKALNRRVPFVAIAASLLLSLGCAERVVSVATPPGTTPLGFHRLTASERADLPMDDVGGMRLSLVSLGSASTGNTTGSAPEALSAMDLCYFGPACGQSAVTRSSYYWLAYGATTSRQTATAMTLDGGGMVRRGGWMTFPVFFALLCQGVNTTHCEDSDTVNHTCREYETNKIVLKNLHSAWIAGEMFTGTTSDADECNVDDASNGGGGGDGGGGIGGGCTSEEIQVYTWNDLSQSFVWVGIDFVTIC